MEMHAGTAMGPWPELESVFTICSVILPLQRPIEKWVKTLFSGGVGTCPLAHGATAMSCLVCSGSPFMRIRQISSSGLTTRMLAGSRAAHHVVGA